MYVYVLTFFFEFCFHFILFLILLQQIFYTKRYWLWHNKISTTEDQNKMNNNKKNWNEIITFVSDFYKSNFLMIKCDLLYLHMITFIKNLTIFGANCMPRKLLFFSSLSFEQLYTTVCRNLCDIEINFMYKR